jgi:nucleotide-binding universal stress UspA family protein
MSFATMMVHIDLDAPCDARIRLAASLATRFHSTLIGVGASQLPSPLSYGGVIVDPQPTPAMIHELSARLAGLGEHFNSVAGWNRQIEWRMGIDSPTHFLAAEARAADVVIIGRDRVPGDFYRTLDPGAFTLRAGRPALVVPPDVESLQAENIVVGWKEAREARRAVLDAMPFLRKANRVCVVECDETGQEGTLSHVEDVSRYLEGHGVKVIGRAPVHAAKSVADELVRVAKDEGADLIVSGAYGHSRLGEQLFGGVTRDLLSMSPICCLLSH